MSEHLTHIPKNVAEALPFSAEELAKYQVVNRGEVQISLVKEQKSVLHIALPLPVLSEDEALIANRWLYQDKGRKIQALQSTISKNQVDIPVVKDAGNIEIDSNSFSYWIESFIPGISLTQAIIEGVNPNIYPKIIEWLADFHASTQTTLPLSTYYQVRFASLEKVFSNTSIQSKIGLHELRHIREIIHQAANLISSSIGEKETVSNIHGDLRADNILVTPTNIGIIDFEQGVNGGDWYSDIEKLLMLSRDEKPDPTRPHRYRPPFDFNEKVILLDRYITRRKVKGFTPSQQVDPQTILQHRFVMAGRTILFDADNTLSSLTYRLIRQRQTEQTDDPSITRLINEASRINNRLKT